MKYPHQEEEKEGGEGGDEGVFFLSLFLSFFYVTFLSFFLSFFFRGRRGGEEEEDWLSLVPLLVPL